MTLAEIFASNVIALRRQTGLSQEKLAQKAHLSVSYISMLERGTRTAPLSTVEVIAKALDATPLYILQLNDHPRVTRRKRAK